MKQYIEKTKVYSAIQYDGENWAEIIQLIYDYIEDLSQVTIIFTDENTISITRSENPEFVLYPSEYLFFDTEGDENIIFKNTEDYVDDNYDMVVEVT